MQRGAQPRYAKTAAQGKCFGGGAARRLKPTILGDDIGQQQIFDPRDLIFQRELLLFKALEHQHVIAACFLKGRNRGIEIAVLPPEHFQLHAGNLFRIHFTMSIHSLTEPIENAA